MGRIIAKRIRGMNWMAKVSLILIFILTGVLAYNVFLAYGYIGNGQMVYNINTTTPQARTYTVSANTFAAGVATVVGAIPSWVKVCAGTARNESVVAYVGTDNTLRILYWNGSTWSSAAPHNWTAALGASGASGRGFDIAVEKLSGDIVVAYTTNAAGTEINFRRWDGATWTAAVGYDSARLTGTVRFIKMESKPNSDDIALIMADTNNDLSAAIWNGTTNAWGNAPGAVLTNDLAFFTAGAVDEESFDLAYEGLSGDLLVAYATDAETTGLAYNTYSGTTWSALTRYANMNEAFEQVDCASDPLSDNIICAAVGTATQDMRVGVWDGAAWQGTNTDIDTAAAPATFVVGRKYLSVGWLTSGATKRGIIVYNDVNANAINWVVVNENGTFTAQTDNTAATPMPVGGIAYHDIIMDPFNKDRLIFIFQDTTNFDIFAKRLIMDATPAFTWNDANGGAVITAAPTTAASEAFHFAYDLKDGTPPAAGTVTVSPDGNGYTSSAPTITTAFTDNESAVTGCQYTTDGSTWVAGDLSGSSPNYTCTKNLTGLSGALTINMRATSGGGTGTATQISRTVDVAVPTDGTLTAIAGNGQVGLYWTAASDAGIGLALTNTYKAVRATGATPPANCTGAGIYQGAALNYTDAGVVNDTQYAYRVCAYDAAGNVSSGVTVTATPSAKTGKIASCSQCHAYPPLDGTPRNTPAGAVIGDHQPHSFTVCLTCHVTPATQTSADFGHRNSNIQMQTTISGGSYTRGTSFSQTNTLSTTGCSNISCHGDDNPTPQWGVGIASCAGCHSIAQGSRRAMTTEFTAFAWSHKKTTGAWTSNDCGVCHMEGNPLTGATTAYHRNNLLEFRDPDTGVTIRNVTWNGLTPGAYNTDAGTDATAATFARNTGTNTLEPFAQAVQVNLCLKCHDGGANAGALSPSARVSGGTATQPFGTSAGTVLDISVQFNTGNASYHPVSGKQNNWYADTDTMNAPWNPAARGGGANNTTYGYLMTCWDCHDSSLASRTIGGANASSTAHGNAVTLRAAYTAVADTATALCVVCHKQSVYWGANGGVTAGAGYTHMPSLGFSALNADNPLAEWTSGSYHDISSWTYYGCTVCHGMTTSAGVLPTRPARAENIHGSDTIGTGGTTWTSGARPYSFYRNTGNNSDWATAQCTMGGCRSGEPGPYLPGGTY
ncbi:MAG: CxxxxCH/CxxCH domain-containing protein [Thermodesulfovibrionales bacterium]